MAVLGYSHLRTALLKKSPSTPFIELDVADRSTNKWLRVVQAAFCKRRQLQQLVSIVEKDKYNAVLLSAYSEYFSPLWYRVLLRLVRQGVQIGVVVHDPIRDFRLGPRWWHKSSVELAYMCISHAFVHHDVIPDGFDKSEKSLTVIPHGIYEAQLPDSFDRASFRSKLGVPANAELWLSFGHIRDSKNLQLAIAALAHFPDAFLLVVGKEQSSSQRSADYYKSEASRLGVSERCRWINRFVPDDEIGCFFAVSDLVLLLYAKSFRSASGVLNTVAPFAIPVLASCGDGPLRDAVTDFNLGAVVLPDSLDEVLNGVSILRKTKLSLNWSGYHEKNTWIANAQLVIRRFEESLR